MTPTEHENSWLDGRWNEAEEKVDEILVAMPGTRLEAQRRVAEALGFLPRPELLHALVRMADESASEIIREGIGRKVVVLRVVVDLLVHDLVEAASLDVAFVRASADAMPELATRVRDLRHDMDWAPGSLSPRDRERLRRLQKEVIPRWDTIDGYTVLLDMLRRVADAAVDGTLEELHRLTGEEARRFESAIRPGSADAPCRVWLDAAAVRLGILDDLDAWRQFKEDEAGVDEGDVAALSALGASRDHLLHGLKNDVLAYNVLVERLQRHQDHARNDGRVDVAQKTAKAQRALFSAYLRLAAVIRNPDAPLEIDTGDRANEQALAEARAVDAASERIRAKTTEELYLEALSKSRDSKPSGPALPKAALNALRERQRRKVLTAVAAFLGGVAVLVNATLFVQSRGDGLEVPALSEFSSIVNVHRAVPLGPVMLSEVPSIDWNELSEGEQLLRIGELGEVASSHGFETIVVIDEGSRPLGRWEGEGRAEVVTAGVE